jgi:beta-glucosidase
VKIAISNRQFSIVDSSGARKIVPGELQVLMGEGQPIAREGLLKAPGVSGSIRIEGSITLAK